MKTPDVKLHILRIALITVVSLTATNTHAQKQPEFEQEIQSPNLGLLAIGGQPLGTHIGRMRHMDWSYAVTSPLPFDNNTYLTGFSYSERGGVLTHLFTVLVVTALAPEAGLELAFALPFDSFADFGLTIEYVTADRDRSGRAPFQFTYKLDHSFSLTGNAHDLDHLPITLTWGLQFKLWSIHAPQPDLNGSIGIPFDFAFPLTRWAQIDANFTISTSYLPVEIGAGATFHLGNRFFLAAGSAYTFHKFGPYLRAGFRL